MRTSLKKLWVEALKSGRYTQATQTLKGVVPEYERRGHFSEATGSVGFCCLGVLCKVLEQHPEERPQAFRVEESESKLEVAWVDDEGHSEYEMNELPTRMLDHLGLDEYVGHLMNMNDGGGGLRKCSFPEIADYIEARVK